MAFNPSKNNRMVALSVGRSQNPMLSAVQMVNKSKKSGNPMNHGNSTEKQRKISGGKTTADLRHKMPMNNKLANAAKRRLKNPTMEGGTYATTGGHA